MKVKTYIITTGAIFGILTAAHIWRVTLEPHLATDPWFLLTTFAAAALAVWAWRRLRSVAAA
jgi:hypothetical protein